MILGTAYFVSRNHAIRYYKSQEQTAEDVAIKLKERAIYVGKPPLEKGDKLLIVDDGCRYAIETSELS